MAYFTPENKPRFTVVEDNITYLHTLLTLIIELVSNALYSKSLEELLDIAVCLGVNRITPEKIHEKQPLLLGETIISDWYLQGHDINNPGSIDTILTLIRKATTAGSNVKRFIILSTESADNLDTKEIEILLKGAGIQWGIFSKDDLLDDDKRAKFKKLLLGHN